MLFRSDVALPGRRDVVVVIRSDTDSVAIVRRKDLLGPVWVNRESRQFANVPQFYFVASTRPLSDIASRETLQQFELGYANLSLGPAPGTSGGPKAFRDALLRSQAQSALYTQHEGAVSFLSGSLFRTTASLPPNVPSGNLKVSVYAFSGGQVVSSNSMTLFIDKTGIERAISTFAGQAPFFYGVLVVLLSVLSGLVASAAFRDRH